MTQDTRKTNNSTQGKRIWRSRWKKIVSTLAAITVFCTTYALILPAITVNSDTYCGKEEHTHSDDCYTMELICGLEEGAVSEARTETITKTVIESVLVDEGHVHSDACYTVESNLVCGIEESEAEVDEDGNVISEGHTHTAECYEEVRTLTCGQEERDPVYEEKEVEVEEVVEIPAETGHVHTEECYKKTLICTKEEHEHSDECFSNPTLDLETAADWEKTLPKEDELTGVWAEDVLTIAKSQLGYRESSRNFKVYDGERKGYTRYGAMFGVPYGDWCAMFIQFCMHYAEVDTRLMPASPGVPTWVRNVKKIDNYFAAEEYVPNVGDIVFFDWDSKPGDDDKVRDGDHIGLVAEVKTEEKTTVDGEKIEVPTAIVALEGNSKNEVRYNTYKIDDESLMGYSVIPEKPESEEELQKILDELEGLVDEEEDSKEEELDPTMIVELASFTESGVQVNFSAPLSVFPEGTIDPALNIVEILPGTPEYDEYFAQAQANAGTEVLNARFFDISVVDLEGNEIKLNDESLAKVEIIFPENETMTTEGNIDVLHFAEEGLEVLESQVQGREEVEAITFDTTSFSPYGVVQTPRSGEGSTDGSSKPALAEKREKSDGTGYEYVVTSWAALKNLIENGNYDGGKETSTTLNIKVATDLGANSSINTNGKTVTLTGTQKADNTYTTVYVDSKSGVSFNQMFWVNGGTFNVNNLVLSGKKADYVAGSGDCKEDLTYSKIKMVDSNLCIGTSTNALKMAKDGTNNNITTDTNNFALQIVNPSSVTVNPNTPGQGDYGFALSSIPASPTSFFIRATYDEKYLRTSSTGGIDFQNMANPNNATDPNRFKWYLRSDGVIANVAYNDIILYRGENDTQVQVKKDTKTDCSPGSGEGTWTPKVDSTVNSVMTSDTMGFFINASNNAFVNLNSGASLQDMTYTGNQTDIAPVYLKQGATMTINGGTIKDNKVTVPKSGNDVLYTPESGRDINWNGTTRRVNCDNGSITAGGVFIDGGSKLQLDNGSIENNTGIAGAVYIKNGTFEQNGGTVKDNHAFKGAVVVDGENSKYDLNGGDVDNNDSAILGGGITVLNKGIVNAGVGTTTRPRIINNKTLHQGGGIYVHSNYVNLEKVLIDNNTAHLMGGGIYVYGGDQNADDANSVLVLDDAYVTGNKAGNEFFTGTGFNDVYSSGYNYGEGGGIWNCSYGSLIMDTDQMHLWGNSAHGEGKDFQKPPRGNGLIVEFNTDSEDRFINTTNGGTSSFGPYPRQDNGDPNPRFQPIQGKLALKNNHTYSVPTGSGVVITNNKAGYAGGGIGSNGILSYKEPDKQTVYIPQFSFTKALKYAGENGAAITPAADQSARFIVNVYDLTSGTPKLVETYGDHEHTSDCYDNENKLTCNEQIVLSNNAGSVAGEDNDGSAVDYGTAGGFILDKWTATIVLPQIKDTDGQSIYARIGQKDQDDPNALLPGVTPDEEKNTYSINDKIRIEIVEVSMTGDELSSYDLRLGGLKYTTKTHSLHNQQNDVFFTYERLNIETTLTNERHNTDTGLEIIKVSDQKDSEGQPLSLAGGTTFQIKNFNYGVVNNNSMSNPVTITLDESNSYRLSDVMAAFESTGMTEDQILDSKFYIQETGTHENNRYNGLEHVIPFRIEKKFGEYKFIPYNKTELEKLSTAWEPTVGSTFYKAGSNRTSINDKVYVEWESNGTDIKGVDIARGTDNASITYTVTNTMKPIEIKVAKLDENGKPLPGATFKLRTAEGRGDSPLGQTDNNPDDGIYTFANNTSKPNFLQPGKAYYLWEDDAPDGYVPLNVGVFIEINEHGAVSLVSDAATLTNNSRYNLLNNTLDPAALANAISNGTITLSDTVDENGVVTINIKNYPEEDLEVEKIWDDQDNKNNTRPSSITVDLYADFGDDRGPVKVTSSDNITDTPSLTLSGNTNTWSGKWENLPSYRNAVKIVYSVKESNVPDGYVSQITYKPAEETTSCPPTTGAFTGTWRQISAADLDDATNGFRIRVGNSYYYANGTSLSTGSIRRDTMTDGSGNPRSNILWTASNISSYYNYNNGYTYYFFNLKNVGANKYLDISGTQLILSDYAERFGAVAGRLYVDERYYYGGYYYYRYVDGDKETTLSQSTTGNIPTVAFEVPVYSEVQGECETTTIPAKYSITNTWKDTVDLNVEKVWKNVSTDHPIPSTLAVTLYRKDKAGNVKEVETVTLSADNNWKHTWTGLRKYDENDQTYEYSISEEALDYYVLDTNNSTTSIDSNDIASGETVESWSDVPYYQLTSIENDGFRIIVDDYVYYLDTSGASPVLKSAHISSNRPEFYDSRSVWTLDKYEKYGSYEYLMQFQSKYDTEIYIGTANSRLKAVRGKNNARDFHYQTDDGEMWWRNGNDMGWFTADIANNSCRARFVKTQKAQWKESGSLKLTNKYEPHAGLELVKVDENGASNQWTDEAVFTLYHMRGQIAPVTLSLSDGKHLIEEVPTSLIPEAGKMSYFFIVETIRPKQGNKEYAQLGTAIPISINSRGEVALITEASQYPTDNFFHTNYNATTKILAAAGSGTNARPAIKVDFSQIGSGKAVSATKDDNRIIITAKNTPLSNKLELTKIDNFPHEGKVEGAEFSIKNASTGSYVSPAGGGWWKTVDGKFKVTNLSPGTYIIREEKAPKNYVKSTATVTVVVDEYTGEITVTPSDTSVVVGVNGNGTTSVGFKYINVLLSYELPDTGGIGTTILYVAGAILVIGAGILLIVRKKNKN